MEKFTKRLGAWSVLLFWLLVATGAHAQRMFLASVAPKGETYGPRMARYLVGYEPDLIAVVGDEGMRGYVRRSEYQWASYGGGVLEVYDLKGAVIDQFTVKAGR